jgi:hypothetical protein
LIAGKELYGSCEEVAKSGMFLVGMVYKNGRITDDPSNACGIQEAS